MRFIHSADWQIGKAFGFAPPEVRAQLQEARNAVVARIAEVARTRDVGHVLVAGDVWDKEDPEDRTLARPIEAMRAHPQIRWHLLPGNHDCHRPNGLWDRLRARGLPENVVLHCAPKPIPLEEGGKDGRADGTAWLLPAPITLRHDLSDTTAWMDQAETPAGAIRIGLAHGTIADFSAEDGVQHNLIAVDRARRAGLAYLGLGDWHGVKRIDDRTWYAGTPETDRFKPEPGTTRSSGGEILVVELKGPGAVPEVERVSVGRHEWHALERALLADDEVEDLHRNLEAIGNLQDKLLKLTVSGTLSLAGMRRFDELIVQRLAAAFLHLRLEADGLTPEPTADDLDEIDRGGFVRAAAERLRAMAEDPADPRSRTARLALNRLYLEHRRAQQGDAA